MLSRGVAGAVRSLQFEDITSQICQHTYNHISQMNQSVDKLASRLVAMNQSIAINEEVVQALKTFNHEMEIMISEASSIQSRTQSQQNMDEGDIELF